MAILNREDYDAPKPVIDLTGPDGNAFMILGKASRLASELDLDAKAITKEMTSGDYEHLCNTFEKHFGHVVDLIR